MIPLWYSRLPVTLLASLVWLGIGWMLLRLAGWSSQSPWSTTCIVGVVDGLRASQKKARLARTGSRQRLLLFL